MCVVAQMYQWQDADTVSMVTDTENTTYPKTNIKNSVLFQRARTSTVTAGGGWKVVLGSQIALCCAELVNTDLSGTEQNRFVCSAHASDPFTSTTLNTGNVRAGRGYTYSAHDFMDEVPNRDGWVVGHDNFSATGPSPASAVATVNCLSLQANYSNPGSRTYWELGFLALGINGKDIQHPTTIESTRPAYRSGRMWRLSLHWNTMPTEDFTYLQTLWAGTNGGNIPCFIYPEPGSKSTANIISDERITPARRGGLMRMLSISGRDAARLGDSGLVEGVSVECEHWQEVSTQE